MPKIDDKTSQCKACPLRLEFGKNIVCKSCEKIKGLQNKENKKEPHSVKTDLKGIKMESNKIFPETKICEDPDCGHKGEAQPVDSFQVSAKKKKSGRADVRLDTCRDCMRRKQKAGWHKALNRKAPAAEKKGVPKPSQIFPEVPDSKPETRNTKLELDFTGRVDLLEEIRRIAAEEEREPERQILFLLKEHVRGRSDGETLIG